MPNENLFCVRQVKKRGITQADNSELESNTRFNFTLLCLGLNDKQSSKLDVVKKVQISQHSSTAYQFFLHENTASCSAAYRKPKLLELQVPQLSDNGRWMLFWIQFDRWNLLKLLMLGSFIY